LHDLIGPLHCNARSWALGHSSPSGPHNLVGTRRSSQIKQITKLILLAKFNWPLQLQRESSGARRLVLNMFVGTCASSAQGKAHRVPLQNFDKLARVRNEKFVATVVVDIDQRSRRSNRIIDAARGSKKFLSLPSLSPICYCCVLLSSSSSSSLLL
jgi:hypothetical protein